MTKKQTAIISILIIITVALGLLVSRRLWFRLDLTKGKSYTISEVSRNLHNEITDQIRLTYYLSDRLKAIHPLPGEIEDLLKEYAGFSRGKIQLTVRDPAKANLTSQIEQLGIMPQQVQTMEKDQASVATVYTGLVIEYLDQIEVLPVVFSLETLEYDITSRIRSMVRGNSRMLGVILGDSSRRFSEDYRQLQGAYMQAGYQLRLIQSGEEIPAAVIPALIVLGGTQTLDEAALLEIDRYIQSGGRVLFTVETVHIDIEGGLEASLLPDGGLLSMLSNYGVTALPEIAMDRSALSMQYQTRAPNGGIQIRITRNPQWIRVLGENGNPEHPVSSRFGGLDLYWASPLVLHAPPGVEADYLFTSTADAWSMGEPFYTNPDVPYLFERDARDTMGVKILGASLTGIFPPWAAGNTPAEPAMARIIVVGDTDFATSFMNVSGGQRNLDFLVQAADWLCNDDDIIGIRSRASQSGRLDKIIDPDKQAAAMKTTRIVNVFVMPLLVIIAGICLALRRRAKALAVSNGTAAGEKERSDDV